MAAWRSSRDATNNPGGAGVDNETAERFRSNLYVNLRKIADLLGKGEYGFQPLKPVFIPKADSTKERVICIPTVRDRLVQRAIVNHLYSYKRLPVRNPSSFGFIEGSGSREAIEAAINLRGRFEWCLKTDIESFFDRVPRNQLKTRVSQTVRADALVRLLFRAIDCEIKASPAIRSKLERQGIKPGVGLRQGMPLSPILSNLLLSSFDRDIQLSGAFMIRYVDDLALFFHTKEEAYEGQKLVVRLLDRLKLTIPSIGSPKTSLVGPNEALHFLGREIVRISDGTYVAGVSRLQISKIIQHLEEEYSLTNCEKSNISFQRALTNLLKSVDAYRGSYRDAHNFIVLDQELKRINRKVVSNIFADIFCPIFGPGALELLKSHHKKFLGF